MKVFAARLGSKNFDDFADQAMVVKHAAAAVGIYPGWKSAYGVDRVARAYKAHNPSIKTLAYLCWTEQLDNGTEPANRLNSRDWYLKDAAGNKVQWTGQFDSATVKCWDSNFVHTAPDDNGLHYPEWYADWWQRGWRPGFTGYFVDNFRPAPLTAAADWLHTGVNQHNTDPAIATTWRQRMAAGVNRLRKNDPGAFVMGNATDLTSVEYSGLLDGCFLEAQAGRQWSPETTGWAGMMSIYRSAMANIRPGGIVVFNAMDAVPTNPPVVRTGADRLQWMRYLLTSCALDDGYFSWLPSRAPNSAIDVLEWFPEFDLDLGEPIDAPPLAPYSQGPTDTRGCYVREYQKGFVFVNPTAVDVTGLYVPGGRNLRNPLAPGNVWAGRWDIKSKDGLILYK